MNSRLILFDIDKTLIKKVNLNQNPWKIAFEKIYGVKNSFGLREIETHGKTHKGLTIEGLKKHNLSEEAINDKLDFFLEELGNIYSNILDDGEVIIFNEIKELLRFFSEKGFYLGLITGNTKRIAFDKLKKGDIDSFFEIGGFGEDSITRDKLIELALIRAKNKFKKDFNNNNIFVIGDTPLDISSAKTHNLRTIGVTTGIYSKKDLEEAGADYVLNNLENIEYIIEIISK